MIKLKKNIVIKVICVILLIIILGAFIIFRINSKPEDLTVKMYKDICEEQSYTFSMIEKNLDIDYRSTYGRKHPSNFEYLWYSKNATKNALCYPK